MEHQEILTSSSSKNWIIVFAILTGLLLTTVTVSAQSIEEKNNFGPEITSDFIVKSFKVKEVNNKLYFKFLILENNIDADYTLESSSNGTDFYAVQLKEGFKSPNGVPLLYCYSVDLNQLNDNTYRIRRDSSNGINYSTVIVRNNVMNTNLSAQKN